MKKSKDISPQKNDDTRKLTFVWGQIKGNYKKFEDGNIIDIELQEDLQLDNMFTRKGNKIRGTGWLIDDRVFIDLGHGRNIILYDSNGKQLDDTNYKQGVALNSLKNNETVLMKVYKSE